jgi:hypothetical protein
MNSPAGERIAYAKRALEAAEFVDEAAAWAHWLISDECQKAGAYLDAMRRVAEIFSIPYGTLWALKYRPPKSIGAEDYFAIMSAYAAGQRYAEARTKIGAALLSVAEIRNAVARRSPGPRTRSMTTSRFDRSAVGP